LIRLIKDLRKNKRNPSIHDYKIILEEINKQFQEIGVTITDKFVRDFIGRLLANSKDKMLTENEMYDDALNYAMNNLNVDNINIKAIVNTDGNIGIYECHKIFKKTMVSQITVADYIEDCVCFDSIHTEYEQIK